ncbi:MAG: hypothetical protein JW795_02050 [Chitinivibrionales bacterium]|nr:hypothetical protein [Chitinivibrionales bacterium]
MAKTENDSLDTDCAWKIYKEIHLLRQLLVQKYHQEFIEEERKEHLRKQMEDQLPF